MKNSMRLVAKMKLSTNLALLFMCLAGTAGFMMVMDASKEMTANLQLLSWGFGLSFIGVIVSLAFNSRYAARRRNAWKDHVRGCGASPTDLMEKMRGAPSGNEVYTFEQAHSLMTACQGSGGSLVTSLSRGYKDLQVLERSGWIYLTFANPQDEGGGDEVVARPTDQTWAAIEAMCPRDWSPEDFITPRRAFYIE